MPSTYMFHRQRPPSKSNNRKAQATKQHEQESTVFETQQPPNSNSNFPLQKTDRRFRYHGAHYFRQRIVLATIFNRRIQISDIRSDCSSAPGLRKYEASLLRLIDRITDGGKIHIDVTGTVLNYEPGVVIGGDDIVHDCGLDRNISYFLEALIILAPFAKQPLQIRLKGITHGNGQFGRDPSVDYFKSVAVPFMKNFGISGGLSLVVLKKGVPPLGGGEVEFKCPIVQRIEPFQLIQEGRIKRVRGTAFTNRVSRQFGVKMIDRARGMLNDFLADVWIYDSKGRSEVDGPSEGYGITLVGETMKGFYKGADLTVDAEMHQNLRSLLLNGGKKEEILTASDSFWSRKLGIAEILNKEGSSDVLMVNEDDESDAHDQVSDGVQKLSEAEFIGRFCAQRLLLEIHYGGVIDTTFQYIPLLFMVMAEEHAPCKVKLGRLTPYTVQFLRHLKDFTGVTFSFEEVAENDEPQIQNQDENEEMETNEENEEQTFLLPSIPRVIVKCVGIGFKNIGRKTF